MELGPALVEPRADEAEPGQIGVEKSKQFLQEGNAASPKMGLTLVGSPEGYTDASGVSETCSDTLDWHVGRSAGFRMEVFRPGGEAAGRPRVLLDAERVPAVECVSSRLKLAVHQLARVRAEECVTTAGQKAALPIPGLSGGSSVPAGAGSTTQWCARFDIVCDDGSVLGRKVATPDSGRIPCGRLAILCPDLMMRQLQETIGRGGRVRPGDSDADVLERLLPSRRQPKTLDQRLRANRPAAAAAACAGDMEASWRRACEGQYVVWAV